MILASTSDIIRVVTGSAVTTLNVTAAWVDYSSGTATPGRLNTLITTATTTTIVTSPGAATYRNARAIRISNNDPVNSTVITIQHYDGTTSVDIEKITLYSNESFTMAEDGEWRHLTASAAEYDYTGAGYTSAPGYGLGISGTVAETVPRTLLAESDSGVLTSGTLLLTAVFLKAGQVVSNITFASGGTPAGTPTNQRFALYSRKGALLAQSNDDTTTAWLANSNKTLAMTSAYTVPVSDIYYVGILVVATTVPTIRASSGNTGISGQSSGATIPAIRMQGVASLTTTLPNPTTIATSGALFMPWAAIT